MAENQMTEPTTRAEYNAQLDKERRDRRNRQIAAMVQERDYHSHLRNLNPGSVRLPPYDSRFFSRTVEQVSDRELREEVEEAKIFISGMLGKDGTHEPTEEGYAPPEWHALQELGRRQAELDQVRKAEAIVCGGRQFLKLREAQVRERAEEARRQSEEFAAAAIAEAKDKIREIERRAQQLGEINYLARIKEQGFIAAMADAISDYTALRQMVWDYKTWCWSTRRKQQQLYRDAGRLPELAKIDFPEVSVDVPEELARLADALQALQIGKDWRSPLT